MKIALASDHAGYDLKDAVAKYLTARGIDFTDFGSRAGESVDYVDLAEAAVSSVVAGGHDRAILVCGTGMGMSVVANKFPGIRATVCWNAYTAEMSRRHNDSNCLTLGGRVLTPEEGRTIVGIWLDTAFEGGRHQRRLDKIRAVEERRCGGRAAAKS
ncbi:MAG: ribose 5-phosphate isomerase B [Candidatus Aminicenantes bacterium]|nr:ribose 5-phosphate isomerase B [Candidatus Aminicenantes bacterium]